PAAGPRWEERRANLCLRRFLRDRVLAAAPPLLWIVDHADRLARWPYGEDVFSLFRSWHNERAFDPGGPWSRLTLALAHAIEATLLVRDSNRSPFNVGTRLALTDFTPAQVAGLNGKLGFPLRSSTEETRFYRLVGGHPYLVRRGLSELAARGRTLAELETSAGRNPEIFGEHLGRTWGLLADHPELLAAVRTVLEGKSPPAAAPFRQLRTLGILVGETTHEAGPRCGLYRAYLCDRLREADDGTGATG
ncbi:MAG: hypothetical protein FJX77_04770, partial [Armatimonadetes bacterium]|nr:hypothetical protein [Armatimonadota bacterium]